MAADTFRGWRGTLVRVGIAIPSLFVLAVVYTAIKVKRAFTSPTKSG